jgi:hypothetical protein
MAADLVMVETLEKFFSVDQIEAMWRQVAGALFGRVSTPVVITNSTFEGGSASGIVVSGPQEMRDFIVACQEAIRRKNGDESVPASGLGVGVDFSGRCVGV